MKRKFTFAACLLVLIVAAAGFIAPIGEGRLKPPEGFVLVPGGSVKIDTATLQVQSFFISATEVSNHQYRVFLYWLRQHGDTATYRKAMIDTLGWREPNAYCEPYVEYYFRHPAYKDYPVVNITRQGAELYCQWLTDSIRRARPELGIEFRLPTRAEFVKAARGGAEFSQYAWPGPYLRNKKGEVMCNFKNIGAESIHYDEATKRYTLESTGFAGSLNDNADVTAPVSAYEPNAYGLYNMCGNAAELLKDGDVAAGGSWRSTGYDVRAESLVTFTKPSPTVGFRPVATNTASIK